MFLFYFIVVCSLCILFNLVIYIDEILFENHVLYEKLISIKIIIYIVSCSFIGMCVVTRNILFFVGVYAEFRKVYVPKQILWTKIV